MPTPQKSILITGCSSGIGHDAAKEFARRGWKVFAGCRKAEDAAKIEGENLIGIHLDYEDETTIISAVERVLAETGGTLDALFNNGAYAIPAPVEDISREAMTAIFNANFLGWHDLTARLIPAMRAQGHGRIVNCSSVLGLVSTPYRGAYAATKFAVEAWSDALRMEMADLGIQVSLIEPGPIATQFRPNAIRAFERWIDWENSPRADQYRSDLLNRLYKGSSGSSFRKSPSAVTAKLIHAVESRRPKARYFVTAPTYAANLLRRALPTSLLDRILIRG
ncbi:MAG: SDR family NAD(P)-dependent oxidoreductase [Boseongicola sp.]|nr:MAG: SDR family NAD(P)-dependent oxidoreductase [Boseongicola sp.]